MLGLLISEMEQSEIDYLLKREMEELLMDLEDPRLDHMVKRSMGERYQTLFQLFRRVANQQECMKYMPRRRENQ